MSANIQSFDNFDSDQQIEAHQSGLVRVVLEGKTDVDLFRQYWFGSFQESFDFLEAGRLVNGSGCTAVRLAVEQSLQVDRVPAIGIVDRDSLFREQRWDLLFEVNDAAFAANAQTPHVHVASLWEIEAYVFDADLLPKWVSGSHRTPPGSPAECDSALPRAIAQCEFLLDLAPFFAASHVEGHAVTVSYFRHTALDAAKATSAERLQGFSAAGRLAAQTVQSFVDRIRLHGPADSAERLAFLLRYVDTKRLMIRLFQVLKVHDDSHWTIPHMQSLSNRRPQEFERLLQNVLRHYES
jgi:hypothetical protein